MTDTAIIQIDSPNSLLFEALEDMLKEVSDLSGLIYRGTVNDYIKWAQQNPYRQIAQSINAYLSHLTKERGLSPRTVAKKRSILRHYVDCLHRAGIATSQDVSAVKSLKTPKAQGRKAGTWLNEEQLKLLVHAPDDSDLGLRDRAVLALLVGCALRVSEVAALRWDHITEYDDICVIKNLSRKHHRVQEYIPIPEWVRLVLVDLYDVQNNNGDAGVYLFPNRKNKPLNTRTLYTIVTKWAGACGFAEVAPHDLRRSASRLLRDRGVEISQISLLLGHSDSKITEKYINESFDLVSMATSLEL